MDGVELLGNVLGAEADLARLVLVDLEPNRLGLFTPVGVDLHRVAQDPQDLGDLRAKAPRLVDGVGGDAVLNRPTDRRPELQPRHPTGEGAHVGNRRVELRLDAGARLEVLGDDHHLGGEIVLALDVERQVEADGAAADIGRIAENVRIALDHLGHLVDLGLGGIDRGICRKQHGDQELGPGRGREELALHELLAIERKPEQRHRHDDGHVAVPHAHRQHVDKGAHEATGAALLLRLHLGGQHRETDDRREDHGDEPRSDERDADHREQRESVLADAALCHADRQEAGNGNQRAGQHREGRRRVGIGAGLCFFVAGLDA